jgi:hypothetical protein
MAVVASCAAKRALCPKRSSAVAVRDVKTAIRSSISHAVV